jgi:hypothetical protein
MAKKKTRVYDEVTDESKTYDRIDVSGIEDSLGASSVPGRYGTNVGPFSVWAIRSRLSKELVSSGGRPARREVTSRKKIPLTESEWRLLDEVTQLVNSHGIKATPGQVAGILLNEAMAAVLSRLDQVDPSGKRSRSALSDHDLEETLENILAAAAHAEAHLDQLRPVALELLRRMREGKGSDDEEPK